MEGGTREDTDSQSLDLLSQQLQLTHYSVDFKLFQYIKLRLLPTTPSHGSMSCQSAEIEGLIILQSHNINSWATTRIDLQHRSKTKRW